MKNYGLEGCIDTHVHSSPDVRERKMTDFELLKEAVKQKVRGIVIKSHHIPTVARAADMNEVCRELYGNSTAFQMYGGITLNQFVGGINPWAVETALEMGGKIVWMPTVHSVSHAQREGGEAVICIKDGKVTQDLKIVIQLVIEHDGVLATSHLTPNEIFVVVDQAKEQGLNKIIISHTESNLVGLTLQEQKRLVLDYDVMLERC